MAHTTAGQELAKAAEGAAKALQELKAAIERIPKNYAVTGTRHGSIVTAISEGEARRIFHKYYNGESILSVKETSPLY